MTRHPAPTIHALPIGSHGDHRPSLTCPCRPIEAVDLADGPLGRLIAIHHDRPDHQMPQDARDRSRP